MTVKVGMFVTMTTQPPFDKEPDMPVAKVGSLDFHGFISDLEASSSATKKKDASAILTGLRQEETLSAKTDALPAKIEALSGRPENFMCWIVSNN
ncbi:UNVERIFIED_CONTAM: hypothetical protein Sangu_1699900 [Sesamum angustifolium]|uniref:Uncharacterized protein n=1 Tax=Sesamum angustifolium TaxID=2727405 RepID=A0AAW2MJ58_9LAMI